MYGLHQGYLYQDLIAAFLLSENLHKKDLRFSIENKEGSSDSFDDVIIVTEGRKTKFQVKHSATNKKLTRKDFVQSSGSLYAHKIARSLLAERNVRYVLATNKQLETAPCFVSRSRSETFPVVHKTHTLRLPRVSVAFLRRFSIETGLPDASFDLSKPGSLEKELLESLRLKVGVGYYPNNSVSPRDIAARLILLVTQMRATAKKRFVERREILRQIGLNSEYGHISQNFPFISPEYRLYRNRVVTDLQNLIAANQSVMLVGPPGGGKSHIFDDLSEKAAADGAVVARHFCYVEPTDKHSQERVLTDTMYGNFFYQLEKAEPAAAEKIRPYFAATKTNVEKIVEEINKSGKQVILMVDGLDHLSRVVAQNRLSPGLVDSFVRNLLDLKLPEGSTLFVASQPSSELDGIAAEKNAPVFYLEPWDDELVEAFVKKHREDLPDDRQFDITNDSIGKLTAKTEGNPLYLTYLLQKVMTTPGKINLSNLIQEVPSLDRNLNNYYRHLTQGINEADFVIVQTLALLDFSVSSKELKEMFLPAQRRAVDGTLKKVMPVLKPGIAQSGVRIYHESFRRYIIQLGRRRGQTDPQLYQHITEWLDKSGFYVSQRAYRYLVPYLIRSDSQTRIESLIEEDFIAKSLYYFHSVESIVNNLNKVAEYSASKQRWSIYCRLVELRRALHTFAEERLDSVEDVYHQAILNVHGVDMFCERLIFDGQAVFSKTYGILLCQLAQHNGGNPPWDHYDVAGISMRTSDASHIYEFQQVEAAHYLNVIRHSSVAEAIGLLKKMVVRNTFDGTEQHQISMLIREFNFVFDLASHYKEIVNLRVSKKKLRCLKLAIATHLYKSGRKQVAARLCTEVIDQSKNLEQIQAAVILGADTSNLKLTKDLVKLTKKVLSVEYHGDKERIIFAEWYRLLRTLSYANPAKVREAKKLVKEIDGWYREWIGYLFELALIETSSNTKQNKSRRLKDALEKLSLNSHPFRGKPRAMDLYGIRYFSTDSFERTLELAKKLENYDEVLSLLSTISNKTTSYLQGGSDGPLSGESFNTLLKNQYPGLDGVKKKMVKELLEDNTKNGAASSVYFDSSAFEYLRLASIFSLERKSNKAEEYLMEGCTHLAAYGFHKDITIYELIEPIRFIAVKDLDFGREAFRKTYPLVESVWRYTDRRETIHSLAYWLEVMIQSDIKTALQTLTEMVRIDPQRDWRIETGTEYLCGSLLESGIDTEIIADLYETLYQKQDTRMRVSRGLAITQALLKARKKRRAQQLFNHICETLYWLSILEYVSEKENFSDVLSFSRSTGLTIEPTYKTNFLEHQQKGLKNEKWKSLKETTPSFSFAGLKMNELRRLVDENPPTNFLQKRNAANLGAALLKLNIDHSQDVQELLSSIVRRGLYRNEDMQGIITIRDIMKNGGAIETATHTSMLGFVYGRGGGGWYALADSEFNYLGQESYELSRDIAKKTLATEMSYLFSQAQYFVGPVRHFIEFFSGYRPLSLAEEIWEEAYKVIRFRLPISNELDVLLKKETPLINQKRTKSVETLVKELIRARSGITS